MLIGAITVGDGSLIGVNALVTQDVPPGSRVVVRGGLDVSPRRDAPAAAEGSRAPAASNSTDTSTP